MESGMCNLFIGIQWLFTNIIMDTTQGNHLDNSADGTRYAGVWTIYCGHSTTHLVAHLYWAVKPQVEQIKEKMPKWQILWFEERNKEFQQNTDKGWGIESVHIGALQWKNPGQGREYVKPAILCYSMCMKVYSGLSNPNKICGTTSERTQNGCIFIEKISDFALENERKIRQSPEQY